MKATKILFPTDFSEHSERALELASTLARESGATLMIVHIKESAETFRDTGFAGYRVEDNEAELEARLHEIVPTREGTLYSRHLLTGEPAEQIKQFAHDNRVVGPS